MPRILIVDDEPEMVRGLEDNLRFEGYQTLSATDGRRGLVLREAATAGWRASTPSPWQLHRAGMLAVCTVRSDTTSTAA